MSGLDQVRRYERIDSLESAGESIEEPAILDVGGTTEIDQSHIAIRIEHNVFIFYVSMHYRVFMEEGESVGHL